MDRPDLGPGLVQHVIGSETPIVRAVHTTEVDLHGRRDAGPVTHSRQQRVEHPALHAGGVGDHHRRTHPGRQVSDTRVLLAGSGQAGVDLVHRELAAPVSGRAPRAVGEHHRTRVVVRVGQHPVARQGGPQAARLLRGHVSELVGRRRVGVPGRVMESRPVTGGVLEHPDPGSGPVAVLDRGPDVLVDGDGELVADVEQRRHRTVSRVRFDVVRVDPRCERTGHNACPARGGLGQGARVQHVGQHVERRVVGEHLRQFHVLVAVQRHFPRRPIGVYVRQPLPLHPGDRLQLGARTGGHDPHRR